MLATPTAEANPFLQLHGGKRGYSHDGDAEPRLGADGRGVEELIHQRRVSEEQLQDDGIPIFIMTALNRKPWFADLEAEGAVILQKPFEIDQFLRLVDDMLL